MQEPGAGLQLKCKFHWRAKSFQAAESLSVCVLVLLFSTVVIARNHKSIISILCLYKTGHLKWLQKGRVAGHNKTWEGQREKYIKKKWDRVLSYSTSSKICLLKNAIIVFFCLPAFFFFQVTAWIKWEDTHVFYADLRVLYMGTTYKDLQHDLGICWWLFLCTKTWGRSLIQASL